MKYRIRHETAYIYADPVQLSHNLAHLRPLQSQRQKVSRFLLEVHPEPAAFTDHVDAFGNLAHFLLVQDAHHEFRVIAESDVEVAPANWPAPERTVPWEWVRESLRGRPLGELSDISQYRHASPFVPLLPVAREYAQVSLTPARPILEAAVDLMHRIRTEFTYDPEATSIATPLHEVFSRRHGVCQDFSHAMLSCLRCFGLAARYVSGYLETLPPPGKERLVGADASHAWVQLWIPDFGWVDLDPTNDILPSERHVAVALGRDFHDVTPLKGLLLGGGSQQVCVSVDVAPQST